MCFATDCSAANVVKEALVDKATFTSERPIGSEYQKSFKIEVNSGVSKANRF